MFSPAKPSHLSFNSSLCFFMCIYVWKGVDRNHEGREGTMRGRNEFIRRVEWVMEPVCYERGKETVRSQRIQMENLRQGNEGGG